MKEYEIRSGLYIVATPIGNLSDISARAIRTLEEVDWIAAEDTRHSLRLLNELKIKKPLFSFHEHSSEQKIQELMERLENDEKGAYISDAGTPGISDPGAKLVAACHEKNIFVSPIPGASAVISLLSVSGFLSTGFRFHGFFPRENKERDLWLKLAKEQGGVHIFYESPYRVREMMQCMADKFSEENMVIGRELTKKFESIRSGKVGILAKEIMEQVEHKGEFVIALELPEKMIGDISKKNRLEYESFIDLTKELAVLGASQKLLLTVAKSHGFKRSEVYDLILEILQKKGRQA